MPPEDEGIEPINGGFRVFDARCLSMTTDDIDKNKTARLYSSASIRARCLRTIVILPR